MCLFCRPDNSCCPDVKLSVLLSDKFIRLTYRGNKQLELLKDTISKGFNNFYNHYKLSSSTGANVSSLNAESVIGNFHPI